MGFHVLTLTAKCCMIVSGDNKRVKHIVRLGHCAAATAQ